MSNRVITAGSINPNATIAPGLVIIESLTPGNVTGIQSNRVGIVGTATWGGVDSPTVVQSRADVITAFGVPQTVKHDLGTLVSAGNFQGNQAAYVCVRVTDGTDESAIANILDTTAPTPVIGAILTAFWTGTTGNTLQAAITAGSAPSTFTLTISRPGYPSERFQNIDASTPSAFWQNLVNAVNQGQGGQVGPSKLAIASLGNAVSSITVGNGGSGYSSAPTVGFTGGGSGTGAAATAVLGFAIQSVAISAPGSYTVIPTLTPTVGSGAVLVPNMKALAFTTATSQSGSGSYVPNDIIVLGGGTFSAQTELTVTHTKVVSATVGAGGSGGTPGTQTVTGTTGTGTKFQASVTVSGGGAITAVLSITVAGDYTVNPTSLTAEPVTGAGLTGATLSVKMGVLTATISNAGSYTVLPTNPVSQASTSGLGTGFTCDITSWGLDTVTVSSGGQNYDNTSVLGISGSGGGAGTLTLASTGRVKSVTVTNGGHSYSPAPSVTFSGGSGTGAAATAIVGSAAVPAINLSTVPYQFSGGTNGYTVESDGYDTNITGAMLLGNDGVTRTGMYALRNTSVTLFALADNDDETTFSDEDAFAQETGTQAILVGPVGETVSGSVANKATSTVDDNSSIYLLGDWCNFLDPNNGNINRLISPQGFYAGLMANLSPEESPLNKPVLGIVSTQTSLQNKVYSDADLVTLMENGIDVIATPSAGGNYFGCQTGKSAGLDLTTNNVDIQRMANFLGLSLGRSGVLGSYIGRLQTPAVRASAKGAIEAFLGNLEAAGQIEDFNVILDESNNPNSRVILGFMEAEVSVQLFSVIIVFLINLNVGTVTIR